MDSHKLSFKLFLTDDSRVPLERFVPVFHRWIQTRALPGHQLIDVADYKHVPDGPGMVLVSHEANIHADVEGGRLGLLYVRKQPVAGAGTFADRLRSVWTAAAGAAALLESDPAFEGGLHFRTDETHFRIYDRLHAPSGPGTFAAVEPDLAAFAREAFKTQEVVLTPDAPGESLFGVTLRAPHAAPLSQLTALAAG